MPFYEYQCAACREEFERRLSIAERHTPTTEPCPVCGKSEITLLASTFALGDPIRLGIKRPDAGFKEVLDRIKHNHPMGNIGKSRFGSTGTV